MADVRLIDADALDLRKRVPMDMGGLCFIEDVETAIEQATTIDAVPVVRCNDCKYFGYNIRHDTYCGNISGLTHPEKYDFCSCGERKDDDLH